METDVTCATCCHSRPTISDVESEGPLLKCVRYPPTVVVLDGVLLGVQPDADEPCGEFQFR